eukprot:scaffold255767_cov40-Prasinocladus_malaysianus.AAC.2
MEICRVLLMKVAVFTVHWRAVPASGLQTSYGFQTISITGGLSRGDIVTGAETVASRIWFSSTLGG